MQDHKKLYQDVYRYMIDKNIDDLSDILSPDFILIHMTGLRQNKKAFLQSIDNGTLNYYHVSHESIEINNNVIIGQSLVEAAVFGGRQSTWHLQLTLSLDKQGYIESMVASTY